MAVQQKSRKCHAALHPSGEVLNRKPVAAVGSKSG
jgi:hypothetical protein